MWVCAWCACGRCMCFSPPWYGSGERRVTASIRPTDDDMYMHVWDGCRGIEPRRGSDQLHTTLVAMMICASMMMPTVVVWLHTPPRCLIRHEKRLERECLDCVEQACVSVCERARVSVCERVQACASVCECVCECVRACACECVCACASMCMRACACMCMHVRACACMCVHVHASVFAHVRACASVCECVSVQFEGERM